MGRFLYNRRTKGSGCGRKEGLWQVVDSPAMRGQECVLMREKGERKDAECFVENGDWVDMAVTGKT